MEPTITTERRPEGPSTPSIGGLAPPRRRTLRLLLLVVLLVVVVWFANHVRVGQPVAERLAEDGRNDVFTLNARYRYYLDPGTLVLDLDRAGDVAPLDLFRGLFQAAEALQAKGRRFDRVLLSRAGKAVFLIEGDEFSRLGSEYAAGQNPVYRSAPSRRSSTAWTASRPSRGGNGASWAWSASRWRTPTRRPDCGLPNDDHLRDEVMKVFRV
ncbi:MAG TPA: hypothetical protein VF017_16480 [Thermoanaerobaculia bacterium]|nr:hypothetical protein [Thermoanaerobaculia bacterium]